VLEQLLVELYGPTDNFQRYKGSSNTGAIDDYRRELHPNTLQVYRDSCRGRVDESPHLTIGHILHFAIVALRVAFWGQLLLQMTRRSMSVGLLGAGSFPQSVAALITRRGNLVRLYVPQTQVEASAIKRDNVVLHTPRRTQ
jgi:hypothetical protein